MRQLEGLTPVDTNLYFDRHNYYVLVERLTKKLYKIQKDDYNKYRLYRGRYLIALIMGIVLYDLIGIKLAIASMVAIALVFEGMYRKVYLPTLEEIVNCELPEKITKLDILLTGTIQQIQKRIAGTTGLFILVAASAVYFLFFNDFREFTNAEKIGIGVLAIVFLIYIAYLGIVNLKAYGIKKQEWEKEHSKKK